MLCEEIVTFEEAAKNGTESLFNSQWGRRMEGRSGYGSRGNVQSSRQENGEGGGGGNNDFYEKSGNHRTSNQIPCGIWIQFPTPESYQASEKELLDAIANSDGSDDVVIFVKNPRSYKVLPPNRRVKADLELADKLGAFFGEENVKIHNNPSTPIENSSKMN